MRRPRTLAAGLGRSPPGLPAQLLAHGLLGVVLGWLLLAALILGDVAGLGALLAGSRQTPVLLAAAAAQFGAGFAVFCIATALFLLPRKTP